MARLWKHHQCSLMQCSVSTQKSHLQVPLKVGRVLHHVRLKKFEYEVDPEVVTSIQVIHTQTKLLPNSLFSRSNATKSSPARYRLPLGAIRTTTKPCHVDLGCLNRPNYCRRHDNRNSWPCLRTCINLGL